jgi:hypothetical protein
MQILDIILSLITFFNIVNIQRNTRRDKLRQLIVICNSKRRWNSVVGTLTGLQAGRLLGHGLIHDKGEMHEHIGMKGKRQGETVDQAVLLTLDRQ